MVSAKECWKQYAPHLKKNLAIGMFATSLVSSLSEIAFSINSQTE
jgi:hypothetical protein